MSAFEALPAGYAAPIPLQRETEYAAMESEL
jgi:hypothetical protein